MKLYNRFFLLLTCVILTASAYAAKPNVYVAEFKNECNDNNGYLAQVRNAVIQSLIGSNRVNIYTPDADMLQSMEEKRRASSNLSESDLEMMRELERQGANAIVAGSLDAVTITPKKNDKGEVTYTAVVSLTLRAINPQDGQVLKSVSLKAGEPVLGLFGATGKSKDAAFQKAMSEVSAASLIEAIAPLHGQILEFEKINKKKVESLYINLGSEEGVAKGHDFAVMLIRKIGGKESKTRIGTIEVVEVQGPDISLCKVKKGKEEIFNAHEKEQELCVDSF